MVAELLCRKLRRCSAIDHSPVYREPKNARVRRLLLSLKEEEKALFIQIKLSAVRIVCDADERECDTLDQPPAGAHSPPLSPTHLPRIFILVLVLNILGLIAVLLTNDDPFVITLASFDGIQTVIGLLLAPCAQGRSNRRK